MYQSIARVHLYHISTRDHINTHAVNCVHTHALCECAHTCVCVCIVAERWSDGYIDS